MGNYASKASTFAREKRELLTELRIIQQQINTMRESRKAFWES